MRVITDLIHDWDAKFMQRFDDVLVGGGARVHRLGPVKPNLNAYAERFVQTLQQECLDERSFAQFARKHIVPVTAQSRLHQALPTPQLSAAAGLSDEHRKDLQSAVGDLACASTLEPLQAFVWVDSAGDVPASLSGHCHIGMGSPFTSDRLQLLVIERS